MARPKFKYQIEAEQQRQQELAAAAAAAAARTTGQGATTAEVRGASSPPPPPSQSRPQAQPVPVPTKLQAVAQPQAQPQPQRVPQLRQPAPQPQTRTRKKPQANPQQASVPIAVYRQLADEVQTGRQQIAQLEADNQQLQQENQAMRQTLGAIAHYLQPLGLMDDPDLAATFTPPASVLSTPAAMPPMPQPEPEPPFAPFAEDEATGEWVMSVEPQGKNPMLNYFSSLDPQNLLMWVVIVALLFLTLGGSFLLVKTMLSGDRD